MVILRSHVDSEQPQDTLTVLVWSPPMMMEEFQINSSCFFPSACNKLICLTVLVWSPPMMMMEEFQINSICFFSSAGHGTLTAAGEVGEFFRLTKKLLLFYTGGAST